MIAKKRGIKYTGKEITWISDTRWCTTWAKSIGWDVLVKAPASRYNIDCTFVACRKTKFVVCTHFLYCFVFMTSTNYRHPPQSCIALGNLNLQHRRVSVHGNHRQWSAQRLKRRWEDKWRGGHRRKESRQNRSGEVCEVVAWQVMRLDKMRHDRCDCWGSRIIAGVQGHYSLAFLQVVIRTEDAPENNSPRIM